MSSNGQFNEPEGQQPQENTGPVIEPPTQPTGQDNEKPVNKQAIAPPPAPAQNQGSSFFATSCVSGSFGCLFGFVCTLIGLPVVGFIFMMMLFSSIGENMDASFSNAALATSPSGMREQIIRSGNEKKIAVININGAIFGSGAYGEEQGSATSIIQKLAGARKDHKVKAVLLQVNSPGGGLTASDIIYNEVSRLAREKPVVVYVSGMAASGGYYVIAPTSYIIVSPTGLVGSFGVIMNRFNVEELMKKIGVAAEPIESTEMKDIGSPFRGLSEEEKAYFHKLLDGFHSRFVNIIATGRALPEEKVRKLATGHLYTAKEAIDYGLVDEEGYFEEALAKAEELGKARGATVLRYADPFPWQELLRAKSGISIDRRALRMLMEEFSYLSETPQFELRMQMGGKEK